MGEIVTTEAKLQNRAVKWLRGSGVDALWFHVPNEGKRRGRTSGQLFNSGVLPGVYDLVFLGLGGLRGAHIYTDRIEIHTGCIELKMPDNGLQQVQRDFRDECHKRGIETFTITTDSVEQLHAELKAILTQWGAL